MSQSHNPTDTQGLLQSMLQRLRLQPGREGQAFPHTPLPVAADGESGASSFQKVNSGPVNGVELGPHGIPSKKFGNPAAESNFGLKGGEIQRPRRGYGADRGLVSFPSQKDNIDSDTGENRVLGQATSPGFPPTGTRQLFPDKSLKDADITSFERTDGERARFGSSATTRRIPSNEDAVTGSGESRVQDPGFTPKVYVWSLKATEANPDSESRENKALHVGNGGLGALAQSKDMQFVASSQQTTNSGSRRKQRSSENKTRRWTQKIKERWLERSGSFGKKGREDNGRVDQRSEQGTEISPRNQLLTSENLISASNKTEDRSLPSLDSSETPPTHTDNSTLEGRVRSSSDFEFGLGSFSLLEEIVTGQEWAKFLSPKPPAASAGQGPPEGPLSQTRPNPRDSGQSSLIWNQPGGGNNQWSCGGAESPRGSDFRVAQADAFLPVGMDVSVGRQQQFAHRADDQSEPMEDGHNQSNMQPGERGRGRRPPSFVEPADALDNSALRRVQLNRKRQHQSAESRGERLQTSDEKEAGRGGCMPSPNITSSHAMDDTGESRQDAVMPSYPLHSSPTPLSPPAFNPFAPAPRGVLKHSISQDSESSMETLTKRRRVEENRRVHFAEEVVAIPPPELDVDATDSEEDSGAEEDSVTEQECEVEQPAMEEVAPWRRPVLPAWIQALKRRNTGRKHR